MILEEQYYAAALICTKSFEYDNKHNPFKVFNRQGTPGICTNENNIVKETYTIHFEVDQSIQKVQITINTYKYSKEGYPVKVNGEAEYVYL